MKSRRLYRQLVRYVASGTTAALVHLFTLATLVQLTNITKSTASTIGFVLAIPVNFLLQSRFVFEESTLRMASFSRYICAVGLGLAVNFLVFNALLPVGVHYLLAQIVAIGAVLLINFSVSRRFVFTSSGNAK